MKLLKLLLLLFLVTIINNNSFSQVAPFLNRMHPNTNISSSPMPYRLCIPVSYDTTQSYPLVLFLHGAGERGTDNKIQLTANQGATLWADSANQKDYPCFVLAPQCASGKQWVNTPWANGSYKQDNIPSSDQLSMALDILDSLSKEFKIDQSKLYVTGLSMGGYGTWDVITRFPTKFAAAIVMCGAGDPSKASLIGTIPIRVYHSSDDGTVPVSGARDMVNAINALGFNDRTKFYTEFTDKGHFVWVPALQEPDLVSWLFTSKPITYTPCNVHATEVSLNQLSLSLTTSDTITLTPPAFSPSDACIRIITWSSNNTKVASVDYWTGKVTARYKGVATIKATAYDGKLIDTCVITVSNPLSVPSSKNNNFVIYPNPTDGSHFVIKQIENEEANVYISDISGKLIYQTKVYNKVNQFNNLQLKQGIYVVTIKSHNSTNTQKLVR